MSLLVHDGYNEGGNTARQQQSSFKFREKNNNKKGSINPYCNRHRSDDKNNKDDSFPF